MKKLFLLGVFLAVSVAGFAQDVDNFEVGPYEVDYKGVGDYKYRMRKDVDLYEFFELKKDTVIQVVETPSSPMVNAVQLNLSLALPFHLTDGTSLTWGLDGSWKRKIGKMVYFNAGLQASLMFGKYGVFNSDYKDFKDGSLSETLIMVGIPLSLELAKLDRKKASMYGSIGVVPAFYTGAKNKAGESKSGILVAPRLDIGGYVPADKLLVRIGGFAQYDINCSGKEDDLFKARIGHPFVGANIGLVF